MFQAAGYAERPREQIALDGVGEWSLVVKYLGRKKKRKKKNHPMGQLYFNKKAKTWTS